MPRLYDVLAPPAGNAVTSRAEPHKPSTHNSRGPRHVSGQLFSTYLPVVHNRGLAHLAMSSFKNSSFEELQFRPRAEA